MGRSKGAKGRKGKSPVEKKRGARALHQKPSGAAFKRMRREREDRAAAEHAQRQAAGAEAIPSHRQRLIDIGAPPDKTEELLPWVARVAAELLHQVAVDPLLDEDRRRKQASELTDKLAKLYPRAALERGLRDIKKALAQYQGEDGSAVKRVKGSEVKRPATARGMRRGPRAVPPQPPLPVVDSDDDGDNNEE